MNKALLCASALAMSGISTAAQASENINYTYDAQGRLVAIQSAGSVNNGQNVATTFDAASNRASYVVTGAGPGTPTPTLNIGDASVTEGGNLAFTVTLSPSATGTVTVNYITSDGTAAASSDYTATSGTLTFLAGQTSKTVTVATVDDSVSEPTETMLVALASPTGGAIIGATAGTGTINDNDVSGMIAITDASLNILPAHSATYGRVMGNIMIDFGFGLMPVYLEFVFLTSNNVVVYDIYSSPTVDPGYSMTVSKRLDVLAPYYGTGVAP